KTMTDIQEETQTLSERERSRDLSVIRLFLQRLAIFVVGMIILFVILFKITVVPSDDMKPALRIGDLELVYCLPAARRPGQVVYYEKDGEKRNGRIVAVAGDTVEVKHDKLYINGNVTTSDNIYFDTPAYEGDVTYPITLKDGEYFVLSDYRLGASDSRNLGPVKEDEIIGNVITVMRRSQI
ncbi:signal peptidase I, partial [Faecalibaculum rodentium]|uniref:signal peptidase I n=3 Tax=Faecalibaculum rodentium TaxID=1702221 RepID=UPI002619AD3F